MSVPPFKETPTDRIRRLAEQNKAPETPEPAPEPAKPPPPRLEDLPLRKVEVGPDGMPRPRGGTRPLSPPPPPQPAPLPPEPAPPADPTVRRRGGVYRRLGSCLLVLAVAIVLVLAAGAVALIYGYWSIARALPSVDDLQARASQFETTRVYDGRGGLIYEIVDPQAGRRTRVPLERVSPYLIAATIATEDKDFYSHPGFDPIAILRAILQNLEAGETVSGASTITQQLVRALVLTPEERAQRSNLRKIREIILAAEITRRYSKDEILALYLNEIYYGNLAYGIEAAAETYFDKTAAELSLGEAAFLAGLPQAPAVYDVFTDRQSAFERHRQVLGLMLGLGCIPVSTRPEPVCVSPDDIRRVLLERELYGFRPPRSDTPFPHWVNYIRQLLEDQYGAQTLYRSGFNVYTTLDPDLQNLAQSSVTEQVAGLADRHVSNGALVALRPTTGEILAMVGSDDYNDPVDGQINMALRPRQPGSSIKPLEYALAFEKGWNPATLLWDVPTEFPDGANPPYRPVNYDGRFHGPVLVRGALANSYNLPAVKTLQAVGLYGEGAFLQFAGRLGISSLTRSDYGLALSLGGGEVPLVEMVGAYGALANAGRRVVPVALSRIVDAQGTTVCQQPLSADQRVAEPPPCQALPEGWGQPVLSTENAFLISDILADNTARTPAFGANSALRLSFPAAVKTGTTNDYRDNWTIGYTSDLVVGVWVGNADFTPMAAGTSGVTGAAPIWHNFMEAALGGGRASPFARPQTIVEKTICGLSGSEPGELCPPESVRTELFGPQSGPPPKERDLWQKAFIDSFTGLRQTAECARYYQTDRLYEQEKLVINVTDEAARKWLAEDPNGQAWAAAHNILPPIQWAPTGDCLPDSPHPLASIAYPPEGALLTGRLQILGQAAASQEFEAYVVEYGLSHDPLGWGPVFGPSTNPVPETGPLADVDLMSLPDGPVTVRVIVFRRGGGQAETRVRFLVQHPTPTPAPTDTPTATPTVTPTPTLTPTPVLIAPPLPATETPSP